MTADMRHTAVGRVGAVLVMVVDSSTPAVTAALVRVGDDPAAPQVTVVAERVTVDGRAHGELLAPQIQAALADGGAAPGDLAAVVAGTGPGPFTGLRAGMGHGRPGRLLVATDARRKEIYWAVYDDGVRVEGPAVDKPADVAAQVHAAAAAGDGADRYAAVLGLPVLPPLYP